MNAERTHRSRRLPRFAVLGCAAIVAALAVVAGTSARTQAAPQNVAEPSISGAPLVGRTLDADKGPVERRRADLQYAWLRCNASGDGCTPISGATGQTYTVTSGDLGSTLRVRVTAKNADGETDKDSNQTSVVVTPGGQPANSAAPTISGSPMVDQTLTAAPGTWVGDEPITYSYVWLQCDSAGNACGSIPGATASTYKVATEPRRQDDPRQGDGDEQPRIGRCLLAEHRGGSGGEPAAVVAPAVGSSRCRTAASPSTRLTFRAASA